MWKFAPLLLVSLLSGAACAQEQSCGALVDDLSARLGIDPQAAEAPPSRSESLTATLKEGGGVIKPPEVGAPAAIAPPAVGDRMPTAPPVAPQAGEGPDPSAKPAARLSQIEALLTAARAAAEAGDNSECVARLAEAEQLAAADGSADTDATSR